MPYTTPKGPHHLVEVRKVSDLLGETRLPLASQSRLLGAERRLKLYWVVPLMLGLDHKVVS